jgi:hypothetical protein
MERWAAEGALGDSMASGRERPLWGKHRTEGAEVTEGDGALGGGRRFGGQHGFWAGKTRFGESIAQRARWSQRGWWVGRRKALWGTAWFLGGKDAHPTEGSGTTS